MENLNLTGSKKIKKVQVLICMFFTVTQKSEDKRGIARLITWYSLRLAAMCIKEL